MSIGTIAEIWRYPVKSMAGERIESAELGALGVPGDRGWAVRDEVRGGIRGAKKIAPLMLCKARYLDAQLSAPEITLPDGTTIRADAAGAAAAVSAAVGTSVTLWPRRPIEDLEHYRRGAPDHEDMEVELRSVFGREAGEPLPDLSVFPPELFEYESPPGTYFDAFPLLLLTDASLRRLQELAPSSSVDVRRFRPNLLIHTNGSDGEFPEMAWQGRRIAIGSAVLEVTVACPRCVMITHPVDELPRDSGLLRTVVQKAAQNVGVYARVETPGTVSRGDEARLV
ncbi:MAG TPA: MOSC domain-containing protein [Candidatus Limnocylindrales bacterium]|nr:MOSC domain-containing protein [Candidatus Limnocylindrales bacterium]